MLYRAIADLRYDLGRIQVVCDAAKMVLLWPGDRLLQLHPQMRLRVCVDDFLMQKSGMLGDLLTEMPKAVADCCKLVESMSF